MGTSSGSKAPDLKETALGLELQEDACSFEFFHGVASLQRASADKRPVGGFSSPEDEAAHFVVNPRLAFPASEIQKLELNEHGPATIMVNFLGLTGPMGVLPYAYSELILERLRAKDASLAHFLDIFNHRAISLFYRAWERYRFLTTYRLDTGDPFSRYLRDLLGLGTEGLADRQQIEDECLMPLIALYAMQSRSATALEQILSDYFDVPIEVQQFTGCWYPLDRSNQCAMEDRESLSCQLGFGAVAGDAVWESQGRARIRIGPLSLARYTEFLPGGRAHTALCAITRFFSNDCLDFEAQLVLDRSQVPPVTLDWGAEQPARLGWISWANTRQREADPDDTVLAL
ncbi:MAG TPA: type VI secretion system baseplate subunit TssG [Terracidiphilus sp.]|nr:type VI secretion system baseplate subunit TssG [Terracidiphilus sp.]